MMQFGWFNHPSVAVAELSLHAEIPPLWSEEQQFVAGAVPSRVREFSAGRDCARRAMTALGRPPSAILVTGDRLPAWPPGIVGSITHGGGHCAAAVACKDRELIAIGIDLEPAEPLDANLVESICRGDEVDWLSRRPDMERLLLARAIFSAKECAYKCLFPVSRTPLDFEDMRVDLELPRNAFTATLQLETPPFPAGFRIVGGIRISLTHIASVAILRDGDLQIAG